MNEQQAVRTSKKRIPREIHVSVHRWLTVRLFTRYIIATRSASQRHGNQFPRFKELHVRRKSCPSFVKHRILDKRIFLSRNRKSTRSRSKNIFPHFFTFQTTANSCKEANTFKNFILNSTDFHSGINLGRERILPIIDQEFLLRYSKLVQTDSDRTKFGELGLNSLNRIYIR